MNKRIYSLRNRGPYSRLRARRVLRTRFVKPLPSNYSIQRGSYRSMDPSLPSPSFPEISFLFRLLPADTEKCVDQGIQGNGTQSNLNLQQRQSLPF
jgi:hypothetical protein